MKKKLVAVGLALAFLLGTAGTAAAHHTPRADGVCGGIGHYNPVTGQCEE